MNIAAVTLLSRVNKSGKTNIKIKISHLSDSRYIATDYYVEPSMFKKNGKVSDDHENAAYINLQLKKEMLNYELKLLKVNYKNWDINRIVEYLRDKDEIGSTFTSFCMSFIKNKQGINKRTAEIYQATLNKIQQFDPRPSIMFEDITAGWLRKFEAYMVRDSIKTNTASIHFRNIRTLFNSAIDDEVISQNLYPFRRFKIRSEPTEKKNITLDQLREIRDYQTKWPGIAIARDVFILSFYLIGINNGDLYNLSSIDKGRIQYSRAKTHRKYSIKVEPEAEALIAKLKGEKNLLCLSDRYESVIKMTKHIDISLKKIMPGLTMYHARHTWATIAKNNVRAADEDIAAALGHTQKTVTQIYINRDPAIVDELNRKVLDVLKYQ